MELAQAHILIIDDNAQVRTLLSTILGDLVAGVREAADAISGLGLWLAMRPQLVFVDYEMPELSGATFIKVIRSQEAVLGARTVVLMISGHSDRDHVMAALEAGADGFVVKPLAADAILQRTTDALSNLPSLGERRAAYI